MVKFTRFKYVLLLAFLLCGCINPICNAQNDSVQTDSAFVTSDSTVSAPNADPEYNSTTIDRKDSIQYFDEIKQQPIFYERRIQDSTIKRIKKDEAYWYADQLPGKQKSEPEPKRKSSISPWVRTLIWIVMLVVFVSVLVWYLAAGNIRVFRKAPVTLKEEGELKYEENLLTINFENEIKKAIDSTNYRLAIRLLFLRALRELNNNGVIVYKPTKTNADYLFQLYGSPYYKPFFRLTRVFDYVWYGKFPLGVDRFYELQKDFIQFNDQLK